ncbi:MAG: hypothetical protein WCD51_00640 [Anaerolineae bacterium]
MAGRRTLILLVALGILAVTVACVPTCSWNWLPFGLGGDCRRGLDEDTLNRLSLVMGDTLAMQPGETWEFSPGVVECCYVFEPVDACATWSVSPTDGATIDPKTGVFAVDPGTPSGEVFTVTADVENGRRLVSADVHVYTPEANPLFGIWHEEAQFACETDEEVIPEERIGELSFGANGKFSVTWHPFEVYKDYWGTYTFDLNQGTLDLAGAEGNYVPEDLDGGGSWFIDEDGRLVLRDMWLGAPRGGAAVVNCGHRFTR